MARAAEALKVITGSAGSIPKLMDDDELRAATVKLRAIAAELIAAEGTLQSIRQSLSRMAATRAKAIDEAAQAKIEGKQAPTRQVLVADCEKLEFELGVLEAAFVKQSAIVEEHRGRRALEIIQAVAPRHRELVRNVIAAAEVLADACDAEADFRRELASDAVTTGCWPGIGRLASAIGSRRRWTSLVLATARDVAPHTGQQPDYSKVVS